MTFFTTPELLEIGNMPFSSPNQKPTRAEALEYYRKVAEHYRLERAAVPARRLALPARTATSPSTPPTASAASIALARASSSSPPATTICPTTSASPAKTCPRSQHYYNEPHPYFGLDVLVIGGKNSAAIAALDLWRHGAQRHAGASRRRPCTATSSTGSSPTSRTASRTAKSPPTSTPP